MVVQCNTAIALVDILSFVSKPVTSYGMDLDSCKQNSICRTELCSPLALAGKPFPKINRPALSVSVGL